MLLERGRVNGRQLLFIAGCIVHALTLLHEEVRLLYRNVVPEHLHLMDNGYVALMDFGFARVDDGSCTTLCGSPAYFAPEVVRGEAQTFAVDWWALGVLVYEFLCRETPWGRHDEDDDMVILKRIAAHTPVSLALPERAHPELADLISQLLHPAPTERLGTRSPTADDAPRSGRARGGSSDVSAHAWFTDVDWSDLASGVMDSPLRATARSQLAARLSEGAAELEYGGVYEPSADEAWMGGFDAQK